MQMEMGRWPKALRALGVAVGTLAVVFSLATCDIFKVGLGAKVDIKAPVLSIGSPDQNEYRQGTIPVSGTISDDLTGVTLTVAYTGKGGPVSRTVPVSNNAWSVDLPSGNLAPADAEDLPEGEQPITFTARDSTGKESEALLIVYVDNTAPTVLVTVPQSYGSPTVSDYIDIKGEAWDASPITGVRVRLLENDGLTPVSGLPESEKTANGTNTWSVRFVVTPLAESVTPYKYAVTVTDKAGNASSYYYHSQDIWDLVEAGELFPAMDDIGRVDQTGAGSSQFTLDELDDLRHLETDPPIGGMKTFADFKKIDDATLPAIHFTSISTGDPVEENVVGTKVPISGYIEPGPAGNPVEGGSLRAWISPGAVAPTEAEWATKPEVPAADVIWAAVGVSNVSFQIEPKAAIPPAVTPDYIPSGAYWIRVAASAQSSLGTGTLTCGFLVDSSVPRFEEGHIAPAADSYVTRAAFAGGTPLAGQTGIAILVEPTDDNGLNPATFAAAAADITSGLPGTPLTVGWSGPAAGVWTVHVAVPDGATGVSLELEIRDVGGFIGRTSPALVFNIDETPPGVSIQSPGNYPGEEGSMLTGGSTTVSGTTDSDVQFVYVWLGLASATPPVYTAWPTKLEVAGNTSWVTLPLTLPTEGLYRVKARAVDFAGNPSPTEDSHDFYRDTGNPAVGETALGGLPGQVLYRRAPFTLGGQAMDSNSVAGVTVTQSKDGAPSTTVLDQALTGTNPAWVTGALPSPAADGTYEYLVTATDVADKTSSAVKRTVVYDTTPPVLSIDGITGGLTILGKVNGTLTFKFSASDSLAGVEKDGANYRGWYRIVPDGTVVDTSAAAMAAWTPLTSAGILFTLDFDTTALGAAGDFDLYVGARDTVTGTPNAAWHKTDLSIEQESDRPVIDFTNLTEGAPASGNAMGRNARLLGTVGDDDGVDSALVQVRVDIDNDGDFDGYAIDLSTPPDGDTTDRNETEAWQPVSNPTPGLTALVSWMHDIGNLPQGVHRVQVRARDKFSLSDAVYADAGDYSWKTSGVESFFIDYGPPVLAITGPANGAIMTADFAITGTASDSYGMDTVTVSIDGAAPGGATSTTGTEFATWSYSFAVAGQNGTHSYQVKAIDDSGAETVLDRQFVVDTTAPETSVETPLADQVTNGTLTIKGTAVENHQLANVYIHIGAQGAAAPDYRGPNAAWDGGAGDDWTGWTALDQTYSWQHDLDTVAQGDGDYTLHVRAVDAGGNVESTPSIRDFSIDQASDRPVITVSTLKESGTYQENLLPATLQVAGTASDDDLVKGGSIQVAVDRNNDGDFADAGERDWAAVSPAVVDGRVVTWANTFSGLTDGSHQLYVRAADTNDSGYGVYSSKQVGPVLFSVDTAPPAGSVTYPGQGAYLNLASLNITGTATDANGIKSVQIKIGSADPVAVTDTAVFPALPFSTWRHTVDYVSDAQVSYQIIVTDNFDRITTIDRYFTFDRTPPSVGFIQPASGSTANGSLLVRGNASDTMQVGEVWFAIDLATDPQPAWPADYALLPGTFDWQKRIRTTDFDDGAYKVYIVAVDNAGNNNGTTPAMLPVSFAQTGNEPVVALTTADNTLFDDTGAITGTVTDDDGVNAESIQINLGSGWVHVSSHGSSGAIVSFSHSLTGLAQRTAAYSVQVRASDSGENFDADPLTFTGPDDIAPVTATSALIGIRKDDAAPSAPITDLNNGLITVTTLQGAYLKDQLTLNGTATDGVQVKTVKARLVGVTGALAPVTDLGSNFSSWRWTRTGLTLAGDTVNLEIEVTDFHDRVTTNTYTLLVDTAIPSAEIETPADNPDTGSGAYNGIATFRGSASDGVRIEKVYYRFSTTAPVDPDASFTGWSEATGKYSWSAVLDTRTVNNTAADSTEHLGVVAVDGAGNRSGLQTLTFTINQASDRPSLTLSAPAAAQVFDANAKAIGTATDDDGVASIEVRVDVGNDGDFDDGGLEAYGPLSPLVSPAGKSFNFEHNLSTLSDKNYRVQFRVRDGGYDAAPPAEKAFHEQESAVVSFAINGAAPVVNLTKIVVDPRYVGDSAFEIDSGFGGSYLNNDSTFTFHATDDNGIEEVEFSIDGTNWVPALDAGGGDYTHTLDINFLTHGFDGTRNLHYRARDAYDKQTSAMVTVIVDTYEPELSFTSPGGMILADAPNVNGDVNVQGTVTDSSAVTGVTIVAGLADQIDLTNTGNNYSWKVLLEDSGQYDDPAFAVDQPGNVWRLPVKVTAQEFARNRATLTGWLDIDPDSDRPQVNVVSPADDDSVAGVFLVSGTVSDDDGAKSVRLQIDLNNDGVYGPNGGFDGDLDLDGLNGTNDDFETESVSKTITVTNGAWSLLLNGSGELNKANLVARGLATASGTIGLRVVPLDIYDAEGPEQTLQVYIDSESPLITGLLADGFTETPNPTPVTGSLQKGTLDLRALFKDDQELLDASLQVSLDGGASFQPISDIDDYEIIDAGTTNPYQYRVKIPVNTATAVAGGNGNLDIVLKITDQTYKQTTRSVQYRVDNTLPEVAWNLTGTPPNLVAKLPFQGSIPDETYSFLGAGSTNGNLLFGKASDTGEISGIARIDVYFVKGGSFVDPRTGDNTTAVTNQTVRRSALDRNGDGDYTDPNEYLGADVSIPVPADDALIIRIDTPTEMGQFDDDPGLGDDDDFNESLKSKSGYEEWFAYFDSTVLPDGPLDVYFLAYDEAGNRTFGMAEGQITNNPPGITSFADHSTPAIPFDTHGGVIKTKKSDTFGLDINAEDINDNPDLNASTWKLTVAARYGSTGTGDLDLASPQGLALAEPLASKPFYGTGGVRDFAPKPGGTSATATVQIDTAADGFSDGWWYRLDAEVKDTDGNKAARSFYLKVDNSDTTPPAVTIDAFDQHSVGRTTLLSSAINAVTDTFNAALPAWMVNGTRVVFAGAAAPGGFTRGTTYHIVNRNPSSFQLSATSGGPAVNVTSSPNTYYLTTEGHVEETNSGHHGPDADLAGTVVITGTASDATSVSSLTVEIDGTELGTATLTQVSGNPVVGYQYTWTYLWNTATQGPNAPARDDTVVRAYGTDPADNSLAAGSRPTVTVDVAPYITSIADPTGISPNVLRGSTGRYSIRNDGNPLTVKGYNFGTSAPTVYVGSATATGVSVPANNQFTFTKSLTRSGYLTVRVGGVDSFNNVNDDGLEQNIEATSDPRTARWTDDRYLWVWATTQLNITNYTGPGSITDYYYPDMVMNGNQPEFAFTDESVGNVNYTTSDAAATKRTGFRLNRYATMATATVGVTLQRFILTSFDSTYGANSTGTGHLEVTGFGDQGNNSQMTNAYAPSSGPDDGGTLRWNTIQGNDYFDGSQTGNTYRKWDRYPYPKMIAKDPTLAGGADIYVAYYDASPYRPEFRNLNFVSFRMTGARAGNLSYSTQDYNRSPDVVSIPGTDNGRSSKYFDLAQVGSNGIAIAYYDPSTTSLKLAYEAHAFNTTGVDVTHNRTDTAAAGVKEVSTVTISDSTRARWVGKFFTVSNTTTSYDVWYDTTGAAGKPAGATAPNDIRVDISGVGATNLAANRNAIGTATVNAINAVAAADLTAAGTATFTVTVGTFGSVADVTSNLVGAGTDGTAARTTDGADPTWDTLTIDSSADVGQYVKMVAAGGKLYIAYYDFTNANLKLARVDWDGTGTPGGIEISTIDSHQSAGTWANIAMVTSSSLTGQAAAQPVITYYADSYNGTKSPIRLAFPRFNAASEARDGTTSVDDEGTYTGDWEIVTVPAISAPRGGSEKFQKTQLGLYTNNAQSLPVAGWVGDKPEYAKLQPNN